MRWLISGALTFLCSACTVPYATDTLSSEGPPPELGRPGWVRAFAGVGGWIGAVGGAVVSVATLPVTFPITLLADEPLGYSKTEFMFAPVTMVASGGHFLFGAPADLVDYTFRRAWVEGVPEPDYSYTPMPPPPSPTVEEELIESGAPAEPEQAAPPAQTQQAEPQGEQGDKNEQGGKK
jgi:hypothetical protein